VVLERLGSVMDACARILQGDHSSQAQADLVKALDELEDARVKVCTGGGYILGSCMTAVRQQRVAVEV
jgi:hypothetical protein